MIDWQSKRHPEDVPTPIAVAVSDFCRRANSPSSPTLVREALSLLSEDDDFRVRALTDEEPGATPLGPYAVVDVVAFGTPAETAAQRQQTGYYDMVRELVRSRQAAPRATPPAVPQRVVPHITVEAPKPAKPSKPQKKTKAQALADRVRPRKRTAEDRREPEPPPAQVFGTAFLPRRTLPQPRGRFTRVDTTRASYETLLRRESRDQLATLVDQVPHRVALLRTLDHGYAGRAGQALTVADVAQALERHGLLSRIEDRERGGVLSAVSEARGAMGRAANGLGVRLAELVDLVRELKLEREVREVRERFIREALAPRNLSLRLELLSRGRYLEDLDILERFRTMLKRDLEQLVSSVQDATHSAAELIELVARQQALQPDLLRRALEQLGLLETLFVPPEN